MSHIESSLDLTQQPALPAYHIASVGRVLTLLKAFADRQQLTVSEAAHLLGVAPSTAHRMLQMLVFHGFATHTDDHTYHRGPAIAALAAGVRRTEMGSVVKPRLIALRDDLPGGTVHLITLEGNGGRFVAGVQSRMDPGLAISRVGWLLPAHTLAGGRSLLAHLPPREIDSLYPDGLPLTRYARVKSVRQLSSVLDEVRGRGSAVGPGSPQERVRGGGHGGDRSGCSDHRHLRLVAGHALPHRSTAGRTPAGTRDCGRARRRVRVARRAAVCRGRVDPRLSI